MLVRERGGRELELELEVSRDCWLDIGVLVVETDVSTGEEAVDIGESASAASSGSVYRKMLRRGWKQK